MTKFANLAVAAASVLLVAGCAGMPTPYQPSSEAVRGEGGYSEVQLAPDRFRVTFSGNNFTSRERVEASLL